MDEITAVKLDERRAIEQELEFIREQMREDREMYVQSRNAHLTRQEHLLNRLGNLDERDISLKREDRRYELEKQQLTLTDTDKVIKQPKSDNMSHVDLQVERVIEKEKPNQEETIVRKGVSKVVVETEEPVKEKIKSPLTLENIGKITKGLEELQSKQEKSKNEVVKTDKVVKKDKGKKEKGSSSKKKRVFKSKRIPSKEVVLFLESVLRGSEPKDAVELKELAEEYFQNEWASFYDMIYVALKTSDFIVKDEKETGKNITYSYNENKRQQTTE
ncbi:hypothetical protein ACQUY5_29325 [Bacillus cereus]|uniref:hypothetical protein n=1 Tax=Bacillus cereus TaxID=1396 RepID=UPI003D1723AB